MEHINCKEGEAPVVKEPPVYIIIVVSIRRELTCLAAGSRARPEIRLRILSGGNLPGTIKPLGKTTKSFRNRS